MRNDDVEYVGTAYGRVLASRLLEAQCSYDMQALMRCIDEYPEVIEYLGADYGTRNAFTRLSCMAATVLNGSTPVAAAEDGDLRTQLAEVRTDLEDAIKFFQRCIDLVGPLEQLTA